MLYTQENRLIGIETPLDNDGLLMAWLLGLVLIVVLSACGSLSPEAPVASQAAGSTGAVVSLPAVDAARASLAAQEPTRQAPTQRSQLGPLAQHALPAGALITDASGATSPAADARVPPAASPADTYEPDARAEAELAQREARQQWLAELREHPEATVRLQALDLWAQQPGDDIEPVLEALGDEDEQVQARAEELWEQQLTREEAEPPSELEEGPGGPAEQ